jgi:hypothetical protein
MLTTFETGIIQNVSYHTTLLPGRSVRVGIPFHRDHAGIDRSAVILDLLRKPPSVDLVDVRLSSSLIAVLSNSWVHG